MTTCFAGIILLVCLLCVAPIRSNAYVCSNYLLPTTTELRKIELGREDLIPQACYKNSKKYDVLLDEDSNGTADLFESEDYVTRKGNMLFDASVRYQKKICREDPKSSYCCSRGIESIDILKHKSCWLKLGLTTKVNGKKIQAARNFENGTATGVFKMSDVWSYRCNGQQNTKIVAITFDSAYADGCTTPDQVWRM